MIKSYPELEDSHWKEEDIEKLLDMFPEGQVVILADKKVVGAAFSLIVDEILVDKNPNYARITGNFTFSTHNPKGEILYGIDVFIHPDYRGLRLGRRLYDARKELCEKLNLKAIVFAGRIPNYSKYAQELTPKKYIDKVKPEARIDGVHLQRQIPTGPEVIVGAVRDPQFGPLMMFGSGGVEVEGLKDVAFALAPLDQAEAEKMIRKTWAGRKLKGFRDIPPADEESVSDVLIKLSYLVLENESIKEIEINPLRVLNKGAIAVDVRVK